MPDADDTDVTTDTPPEADTTGEPTPADEDEADQTPANEDTFPRRVVEELRRESAGYRERAKAAEARAEALATRLHAALVAATGKLADPADLPFDAEHLDDGDRLDAAIDALTAEKPHLKSRRPFGDVGQGIKGKQDQPTSLLSMLKAAI